MAHGGGKPRNLRVWSMLTMRAPLLAGAFADRTKLQEAVNEWVLDDAAAAKKYGSISDWDASRVDDLSNLFASKTTFNGAVGGWDTSRVKWMSHTFYDANSFNQPLVWGWRTRSTTPTRSISRSSGIRAR